MLTPSVANKLSRPAAGLVLAGAMAGLAVMLLVAMLSAPPSRAGTLCVKPGGGLGCEASIQDALNLAHPGDTILVVGGTYVENVLISRTVTLQGGWAPDLSVRDLGAFSVTIRPADSSRSVVSIQGRFTDTAAVAPVLDGFVITGGRADLGSNHGGGLRIVDSDAVVISNTIRGNVAFLLGGGVWVQRGAPVLQGNEIADNMTVGLGQDAHGGGVQLENSQAALLGNTIAGNVVSGTQAYGGGVEVSGTGPGQVTLRRNRFISNTASLPGSPADSGFGGAVAVSNGKVLLEDSRMISNTAATRGGGLFIGGSLEDCCNVTASGNLIQANSAGQGGGVFIGGTVGDCCQFSGSHTQIRHNDAGDGGGLYNAGQVARIRGGLVFSNTARVDGGGVFVSAGAFISLTGGAAVANLAGEDGGGIYNAGFISVTNTTVSGNSAGGMGGGVANFDLVDLVNATVADNAGAGGAGFFNADTVNTVNSLIALNAGDNCVGSMNSLGHNLEDGSTCALGQPTDMPNTAPSMGGLGDNGGPTPTHALMGDSPAIDAGDNAACAGVDQRGIPRPLDGDGDGMAVCDVGAFEYQVPSTTAILSDGPDPSEAGQTFTVTFAVTAPVGTPTGVVSVTVNDSSEACSDGLDNGMGSCALTLSLAGTYTLTAAYGSDDGSFDRSSDTAVHAVTPAPARPTTIAILSDAPDPSMPGEFFTVTFGVTGTLGLPGGGVTVTVSGDPASCSGVLGGGLGSCSLALATPGAYTLTAAYAGDAAFAPSSDTEAHSVLAVEGSVLYLPVVLR